ncbi:Hypothetical protein KLENKIAIHU_1923, partial [Klenkia terrae]
VPLKLPVASVVALLGPAAVRAQVCGALDENTARCAGGHGGLRVTRLGAQPGDPLLDRLDAVRSTQARIVLVERLTAGLDSGARRLVLSALEDLAGAGATVVVDDDDPVAVLAVADAVLRVTPAGEVLLETLPDAQALAPLLP